MGVAESAQRASMCSVADLAHQRRASAEGAKQMDEVDASRATGIRSDGYTQAPQAFQLEHELRIEPLTEEVSRTFLQHGEEQCAVYEGHSEGGGVQRGFAFR